MTTHGTKSSYNRGCRCDACKEASRLARARQRQTARERSTEPDPDISKSPAPSAPKEAVETGAVPAPAAAGPASEQPLTGVPRTHLEVVASAPASVPERPDRSERTDTPQRASRPEMPTRPIPHVSSAPARTDHGLKVVPANEPMKEASEPDAPEIENVPPAKPRAEEQRSQPIVGAPRPTWAPGNAAPKPLAPITDLTRGHGPSAPPAEPETAEPKAAEPKAAEPQRHEPPAKVDLLGPTISTSADAWQEISKRLVRAQQTPARIAPLATDVSDAVTRALSEAEAAFQSELGRKKPVPVSTEAPRPSAAQSGHEDSLSARRAQGVEAPAEAEGRRASGPAPTRPTGHEPRRSLFGGLSRRVAGSRTRPSALKPPEQSESLPPPPRTLPPPPASHLPPPPSPLPAPPKQDADADDESAK